MDLFFIVNGRRYGVEMKYAEAPRLTRSMQTAVEDLSLDHLWVIYPGEHAYEAHPKITVWLLRSVVVLAGQLGSGRRRPRRTPIARRTPRA